LPGLRDDHPDQGDALSALHNEPDGKRAALGRRLVSIRTKSNLVLQKRHSSDQLEHFLLQ
jgi:hypothetical protein